MARTLAQLDRIFGALLFSLEPKCDVFDCSHSSRVDPDGTATVRFPSVPMRQCMCCHWMRTHMPANTSNHPASFLDFTRPWHMCECSVIVLHRHGDGPHSRL